MAGRLTLAKSVLMALPAYVVQTFALLKSLCNQIDGIVCNFIWGSSSEIKKPSLVKWADMCCPCTYDGGDILSLKDFNKAFFMKMGFTILPSLIFIGFKF